MVASANRFVIDASVLVKLFVAEEFSDHAARLMLASDEPFLAPDLVHAEAANVLWKKVQRRVLSAADVRDVHRRLIQTPIVTTPAADLAPRALACALRTKRTVYDCMYLVLAVDADAILATADRTLVNGVSGHADLRKHLRWIGDW